MKVDLTKLLKNNTRGGLGKRAIALAVLIPAGLISTCLNFAVPFQLQPPTLDRHIQTVLVESEPEARTKRLRLTIGSQFLQAISANPSSSSAHTSIIDMRKDSQRLTMSSGSAAYAIGAALPPGVSIKNPVKYRVRMRTKVVVPHTQKNCRQIQVWHALPTTRPWSRVTRIPGVTSLAYLPKTGKVELGEDRLSAHVYFEENANFIQGQIRYFQSDYELFSCERNFDSSKGRAVTWKSYTAKDFRGLDPPSKVNREVSALADRLKSSNSPIDFVVESCKWIRENIKYDASVPYAGDDADAIMQNKRGHCGHAQTIFEQLCARAGVPYKSVLGLDLSYANGIGELSSIRADYTNAHTWAQVFFPGIGWIEVDTVEGANCFKIDGHFVQNNTAFENYSVWVTEGEESREVEWRPENGKFVCDYGVENMITFSQSPG